MIIWKLTYRACDEICTQHFLSREAAECVSAQIPNAQDPIVEGVFVHQATGFRSKARAVSYLNQLRPQIDRPQT